LIDPQFFESLSAEHKILIDHGLLNRIIESENEAQEKALKNAIERNEHPGMERYESDKDFWAEVEDAENEQKGYA